MANSANQAEPGVWLNSAIWPLRAAYRLVLWALLSWIMALALAWVCALWVWEPGEASRHLHAALTTMIGETVKGGLPFIGSEAATFTLRCANYAYELVFVKTGLEALYVVATSGISAPGIEGAAYRIANQYAEFIEVSMAATRLYGTKLALLLTAAPMMLFIYIVGAIDGLVARYVRTQGGGRESAFIYHRSKFVAITLLGTLLMAVLLSPVVVDPQLVLPATGGCFLLLSRLQWQFYKKYI